LSPRQSKVLLPRLAFRVGEAAAVIGVSEDHFARHVAPELRWVRRGRTKLVSRAELERWLESSASRVLDDVGEA
jgi:excisionase family DNA binding protein